GGAARRGWRVARLHSRGAARRPRDAVDGGRGPVLSDRPHRVEPGHPPPGRRRPRDGAGGRRPPRALRTGAGGGDHRPLHPSPLPGRPVGVLPEGEGGGRPPPPQPRSGPPVRGAAPRGLGTTTAPAFARSRVRFASR